jgi:hypothetical protein
VTVERFEDEIEEEVVDEAEVGSRLSFEVTFSEYSFLAKERDGEGTCESHSFIRATC